MKYFIIDVFAERNFEGNQLTVFLPEQELTTGEMQKIAREFSFSETTFVLSDKLRNGGYDIRIFTPDQEIPFAGHPSLGTAYIIRKHLLNKSARKVVLNLKIGQIMVTFSDTKNESIVWMKQKLPEFSNEYKPVDIAPVLSLETDKLKTEFPIQKVSTGIPFIIVPLKTLTAIRKAQISPAAYAVFSDKYGGAAFLLFTHKTYSTKNDLNVRVFAGFYGVPEDPATGSAAGCLAGYLIKHGYYHKNNINIKVEQGHEIGRPSLLYIKAEEISGRIDVNVGGKVKEVASGELLF